VIGNNKLSLNEATIIAAVQMYLDSERRPDAVPVKVMSVHLDRQNDMFEVRLEAGVLPPIPGMDEPL
jgi:hypothetical protein